MTANNELTMSSREIAEATGKQHQHVKRDIQRMFAELDIDASTFGHTYIDGQGRQQSEYRLNRYYTELLITGYDVRRRAAVIDRWMELEEQVAQPKLPQSFAEALRLAADTQEQLEEEHEQRKLADARRDSLQRAVGRSPEAREVA